LVFSGYVLGSIGHSVAIFRSLRLGSSDYTFGIFWLCLWYLLITPLISSDYTFWYLLITTLVSFDHSIGIFRSLLWYLLITPLISSDCTFGIFWLHPWYLLITHLVSSDYPFGIFWLPIWYFFFPSSVLITPFVSSDKLFIIFWLTPCYSQTFCVVVIEITDHLLFAYQVLNLNYPDMIIWEIFSPIYPTNT
jgi:hypothetical protein